MDRKMVEVDGLKLVRTAIYDTLSDGEFLDDLERYVRDLYETDPECFAGTAYAPARVILQEYVTELKHMGDYEVTAHQYTRIRSLAVLRIASTLNFLKADRA